MAEQNCPICGQVNPDKSETCQKCGANLFWAEVEPGIIISPLATTLPRDQEEISILPGIEDGLPAVPAALSEPTAPVHLYRLAVSDTQGKYVALLEKMTHPEPVQPAGSPVAAASKPRYFLLGWGILLVGFLLVSLLWEKVQVGIPPLPSEVLAVNRNISKIPAGAPVLVAVDYQPAYLAEMEMASEAVIDQLIAQGTNLVFVSTVPTGFWQAEHLIKKIESSQNLAGRALVVPNDNNLGFIPGSALGLANFVQEPQKFIQAQLPGESTGSVAQDEAVQDITSINDFSAIIVLTEDPDSARDWLEQVQPHLTHTPLMMVLSAQAEPMVKPYLEMQPAKIQGMLVGIAGGVEYESLSNQVHSASENWTASVLGNILGGLALGGALVAFLVYHRWNQQSASAGKEKKE
jgi:hypothetical protein